jgi:LacI family transcriptional regulator
MVSYSEDKSVYFVGTDHEKGGYIAAQHLIKLGYKKIGYINAELGNPIGELRKNGFLRALREKNIAFKENFEFRLQFRGDWDDYFAGYKIGEEFVQLKDKPEAMFVYKDLAALGFQRALLNHGIYVPGDVAIVGFDDIKRGVVAPVPLTTIHQPTDKIGELAFDMIKKQIKNEFIEKPHIILKPSLVIRESCGAKQLSDEPFFELKISK